MKVSFTHRKKLLLLLFFIAVVHLLTLTSAHSWGCDFALYIMQADALGSKDSIHALQECQLFSIENTNRVFSPVFYPWLYPLLLRMVFAIGGNYLLGAKLLNVIVLLGSLLLLYAWLKGKYDERVILLVVALTGLLPTFIIDKNSIASDFVSLFLLLAFLLQIQKGYESQSTIYDLKWGIGIGAIMALAFLTRLQNMVLIPVLLFFQIRELAGKKGKCNWLALIVPYLVLTIICLSFYSLLPFPDYNHVFKIPAWQRSSWQHNLQFYAVIFSKSLWLGYWHAGLSFLLLPFTITGVVLYAKKLIPFWLLFLATLLLVVFTPFEGAFRYINFAVPVYLLCTIGGSLYWIDLVASKRFLFVNRKWLRLVWLIPVLLFLSYAVSFALKKESPFEKDGPYTADFSVATSWVRQHLPEDKPVVFYKPRTMLLFSGHRSFSTNDLGVLSEMAAPIIIDNKDDSETWWNKDLAAKLAASGKWDSTVLNRQFTVWQCTR